ncbi:MAG: rod shape-determining protein [Patescibacteria group bacterium]
MGFQQRLFKDIGIDLGTANTLIYARYEGVIVNEPSVAAVNNKTNQILAVGEKAKGMLERTPSHVSVIRPLSNGVISDFDMTHEMLSQFFKRIEPRPLFGLRRGLLGIPNDLTEVERKSVEDAAKTAGCGKVFLVESTVAAALGANLPIETPVASLIIDIGGGTTDVAVISYGGIVVSKTLKVAGDKLNEDIIRFMRDEFKLAIGEPTAEFAKIAVGSALPLDERLEIPVRGRDYTSGLPREVLIKNTHVRAAFAKSLRSILDAIHEVIELTPPELAGDMLKQGIWISGGGALLRGIDELIEKETSVRTQVVEDPLSCMVRGLGRMVDNFEHFEGLLDNPLRPKEIKL